MIKCSDILVLLIVLYSISLINCNVTINGTRCGQIKCSRGEYCTFHKTCESCAKICDTKNHNFDESLCTKDCQDYIHDELYMLKDGSGSDENLKATVQKLSRMVTVTLSFVCFMLIVLASILFIQLYRWKKKNNITIATVKTKFFSKKSDSGNKASPVSTQNGTGKPELRLEMPTESTHSGNSPVTVTTSISRRPAEDSTLDYAYDNPAMSSSPTNNKPGPNNY